MVWTLRGPAQQPGRQGGVRRRCGLLWAEAVVWCSALRVQSPALHMLPRSEFRDQLPPLCPAPAALEAELAGRPTQAALEELRQQVGGSSRVGARGGVLWAETLCQPPAATQAVTHQCPAATPLLGSCASCKRSAATQQRMRTLPAMPAQQAQRAQQARRAGAPWRPPLWPRAGSWNTS